MELNQAFTCLLLNSIEAIDGRGEIRLRTWVEAGELRASVADTGRGIAAADLDKVFDPGFTTKGVGVGTGLGLPTCKRIVERHGGRIHVESRAGQGTSVTIRLPLGRVNDETRH
jgi:signal transduction histidine kinase